MEFTSTIYPYTLTLPGGAARGTWAPATEEWDGVLRIDHGGRFADSLRVDDGDLFLYGTPWVHDVQQFAEVVHDSGVEYHGCRPTPDSIQGVEVAGVPALVYTMLCAGTRVVRVAFVRDGYGLVAVELLASGSGGQEPIDRLLSRLEGLTWTGP